MRIERASPRAECRIRADASLLRACADPSAPSGGLTPRSRSRVRRKASARSPWTRGGVPRRIGWQSSGGGWMLTRRPPRASLPPQQTKNADARENRRRAGPARGPAWRLPRPIGRRGLHSTSAPSRLRRWPDPAAGEPRSPHVPSAPGGDSYATVSNHRLGTRTVRTNPSAAKPHRRTHTTVLM